MTVLVPILGDQLSHALASLQGCAKNDTIVLMMEVAEEATHVRHHKAKIALIFSAMRHFAAELRADGWQVDYIGLDDPENSNSFTGEVIRAAQRHAPRLIRVVEPGDWRVEQAMLDWQTFTPCPVEILPDSRFLCSRDEFAGWAAGRKELRMEFFYREMRRRTGLLMDGKDPVGGKWNYDAENRSGPPPGLKGPPQPAFAPDGLRREVIALVGTRFAGHFGSLEQFNWPVTAAEAELAASTFLTDRLPSFGQWQDAMVRGQDFLFHAVLSPAINLGLLDPVDLCRRAEAEYHAGRAPLAAVEGFIRQLIGWREYIRGVYWLEMPGLAEANFLQATRPLPDFYWTGETDMACLADCVRTTRDNAYAHHIQRLMVIGSFCLTAGVRPREVEQWFLGVYVDAFEWVELPNVIGMSQHADGGFLGSKPYCGAAAYINKMSDYCKGCAYDPKDRLGPLACPLNALYWDFWLRHAERFRDNPRIGMAVRQAIAMPAAEQRAVRAKAAALRADIDNL